MSPEHIGGDVLSAYGLPADAGDADIRTELMLRHTELTSIYRRR